MDSVRQVTRGRLRRLTEELIDEGSGIIEASSDPSVLVDELDYALHPPRHEQRIPTYGSIVLPTIESARWAERTGLGVTVNQRATPNGSRTSIDDSTRRYADGVVSWTVRHHGGIGAMALFEHGVDSERDLVVLAEATGAAIVQRRTDSGVRIVGSFGVARWDGWNWHVEPPFDLWVARASDDLDDSRTEILANLLRFAVHDLGAAGIGALLILDPENTTAFEERISSTPPPLKVDHPPHLGPLRHVLSQVDGAAVFSADGQLRELGIRLVPSLTAEASIEPLGGTRHTSARRYSFDDPTAIVVTVSESGPVTVFRGGAIIGRSTYDGSDIVTEPSGVDPGPLP